MPRPVLKRKVLIGAPAIVEEAVMIVVPPPIVSAEAKKSAIPSARKSKAQEGYFIGWMLSNVQDYRGRASDFRQAEEIRIRPPVDPLVGLKPEYEGVAD